MKIYNLQLLLINKLNLINISSRLTEKEEIEKENEEEKNKWKISIFHATR